MAAGKAAPLPWVYPCRSGRRRLKTELEHSVTFISANYMAIYFASTRDY